MRGLFTEWGNDEPNNAGKAEHCVIMYTARQGNWFDVKCEEGYYNQLIVCEKQAVYFNATLSTTLNTLTTIDTCLNKGEFR